MMYMCYKSAKLGIWTSWESPRGLPEIVILDWDWIEPVGVNQVRKTGKCVSGKGNCMYKAESTLAWICLYPTSKGSQGRFFSSESQRVMSISWYIFRKDHASAHWGLRTSGLAWTLAAVLQDIATTLSRPMAWRWSLLSTAYLLIARKRQDLDSNDMLLRLPESQGGHFVKGPCSYSIWKSQ